MKINVKIPKKINIGEIRLFSLNESGTGGVSYEIGDIYITTTNTNPNSRLGGEWELIDKHFKEWSYYSSDIDEISEYVTPNLDNATPYAFGIIRGPHSVYIRYYFRNSVTLQEQKISIGHLKFEKFGINNGLYFGIYDVFAGSEEGIALMNVSSTTGEMYSSDAIGKPNADYIPINTQVRFEVEARMPQKYMLDEHCDKFFWKKIA